MVSTLLEILDIRILDAHVHPDVAEVSTLLEILVTMPIEIRRDVLNR